MDILDTSRSDHLLGLLDGSGDVFRGFDLIDLDVDHPEADSSFPVEILDGLQVILGTVGEFQDEVVGMQGVEEFQVFQLTSPDYSPNKPMSPFDTASTRRPAGTIFSEQDQFILRTLYYPFRVRFGYQEPNAAQFTRDLQEIHPLFSNMLGFEEVMLQQTKIDQDQFQHSGPYLVLRACFQERWSVLNQHKDYPHMLQPLRITGLNK